MGFWFKMVGLTLCRWLAQQAGAFSRIVYISAFGF
jgi:hypothetical protein